MATDLAEKPKAATPRYESFVDQQIARVRGRVRAQDAGKALLFFLIFTLAYGLGMALADRTWELSALARLMAFGVFALGGLVLLGWSLLCLLRRVNPYYAARQLEQTLPDTKNSLVNWLDLRDEKLPPVIHNALGLRAARDLKKADPEQAVSAGPTWILAAVLGGLILALLILFVMGPHQFASLMNRTFFPFREGYIVSRTTIEMIEPDAGDVAVPPSRPITFRARIDGPVPVVNQEGAPKILWRYAQADPFVPQSLEKDVDDTWTWTMPADQVINGGLWYKVTAGDTETPEHQIRVSPIPQVRAFDVTYHYRAYERRVEDKKHYPKAVFSRLHARRGTEVTLHVQTNCDVAKGHLQVAWEGKDRIDLPAQVAADDPGTLRFPRLLLDAPGAFRIVFTSRDGKSNIDNQSPYPIIVFEEKPGVEIVKPQNISLPLNGTLQVEGASAATLGIKGMSLHIKRQGDKDTAQLDAKPYRPAKSFKLANGSYPPILEYKDFIALEKLKTAKGEPFPLTAGMKLDYWLEAVDASDYPDLNGATGYSKHFTVTILDAEKDQKKQEQDRQKAHEKQKQHNEKQDQDVAKQNEVAKGEKQPEKNGGNQGESQKELEKRQEEARKTAEDIQKRLGNEKPDAKQPPGQKQNGKGNQPQDPKTKQSQDPKSKQNNQPETKDQQPKVGEPKGADQPQSDQKSGKSDPQAQQPQAKDNKQPGKENPGKEKDAGKNGQDNKAPGQSKDDGPKSDKSQKKEQAKGAEAKDGGKKSSESGPPGAGKEEAAGQKEQTSDAKSGSPKGDAGQPKNKGSDGQEKQMSEAKKGPADNKEHAKHGQAKGPEKPENSAKSGENTGQGNEPQAKTGKPGPRPSETKPADPNAAKSAGTSKEIAKGNQKPNGPPTGEKMKEPTPDEIAQLAKDLKFGDPKKQRDAENELRRICRECQNPNATGAAGEALSENNKTEMKAKGAEGSDEKAAKGDRKDQGESGLAKEGQAKTASAGAESKPGSGKGQGEADPDGTDIAKSKSEMKLAGGSGAGAGSWESQVKPSSPHKNFEDRGGNLQLEDMKKLLAKTTAKQLKDAGITEQQWQQFAKAVQEYEKSLQKMNRPTSAKKGNLADGISHLPNTGPSQLNPASNRAVDPLEYSRAQPPPEFREAARNFTATAGSAPEKKK